MSSTRVKIVVVGPKECGKTALCNYLAKTRDSAGEPYSPTVALRIVEVDREDGRIVELWDASGDMVYQNTWPAIAEDMNGAIMVYNPGKEKDLELWYRSFVLPFQQKFGFKDSSCLIMCHKKAANNGAPTNLTLIPRQMSKIPIIETNLDIPSDDILQAFDRLVQSVVLNAMNEGK